MAEQERPPVEIRVTATPQQSLEFLEKLARDDEFRDGLRANPRDVLAGYGVEISEAAIPKDVELPPKEHVEELLATAGEMDPFGRVERAAHGYGFLVLSFAFARPFGAEGEPTAQ